MLLALRASNFDTAVYEAYPILARQLPEKSRSKAGEEKGNGS
jgi:hypothetical protein